MAYGTGPSGNLCASAQRDQFAVFVSERGDNDNGCAVEDRVSSEHPAQFKAVNSGHQQVNDRDVGTAREELSQGGHAVEGANCLEPRVGEKTLHEAHHGGVIIHEQYFVHCCPS